MNAAERLINETFSVLLRIVQICYGTRPVVDGTQLVEAISSSRHLNTTSFTGPHFVYFFAYPEQALWTHCEVAPLAGCALLSKEQNPRRKEEDVLWACRALLLVLPPLSLFHASLCRHRTTGAEARVHLPSSRQLINMSDPPNPTFHGTSISCLCGCSTDVTLVSRSG